MKILIVLSIVMTLVGCAAGTYELPGGVTINTGGQDQPGIVASSVCPTNFQAFRGRRSPLTCECSAEATQRGGVVFGTDVYADLSTICLAAVHAGVITPRGGTVRVVPQPGRNAYSGVERNGVISLNSVKAQGSFGFAK